MPSGIGSNVNLAPNHGMEKGNLRGVMSGVNSKSNHLLDIYALPANKHHPQT